MSDRPRAVLFDLGGVLLELGDVTPLATHIADGDVATFWERWILGEWPRRLETGTCSPEAFARGCVESFALPYTPEAFLSAFAAWPIGPFPGAFALLDGLRRQAHVACLSNTNVVHMELQEARFGWRARFDTCLLSHELGLAKPDPAVYRHVVKTLDLPADAILFMDDNAINVEGAREVGLRAVQVSGLAGVRSALQEAGFVLPIPSNT